MQSYVLCRGTPFHARSPQVHHTPNSTPSAANVGFAHEDELPPTLVPFSHPKIPELPCMHPISFEFFFFAYLLTALFGQYLFIYKVTWLC